MGDVLRGRVQLPPADYRAQFLNVAITFTSAAAPEIVTREVEAANAVMRRLWE